MYRPSANHRIWFAAIYVIAFATQNLFMSAPAFAVRDSKITINRFPVTKHVAKQVWFWEEIFKKYPSNVVLIHDSNHPEVVIDLIDLTVFAQKYGSDYLNNRKKRERFVARYLDRYNLGLKRFQQLGRAAVKFGPIEQRLANVYQRHQSALVDLLRGTAEIRSQAGLADEFQVAVRRAAQYLPRMERIFAEEGVPVDLTRLAFVESMFNLNARSKVGASGVWQFMPDTARRYMMYVNALVDERNSPLKATRAAARLLRDNYQSLRSWPLAITAYNHGRGGMSQAARDHGNSNFDDIIKNYESRSFGFASKNFYSEFLAAKNVYNGTYRRLIAAQNHGPFEPVGIRLRKKTSVAQILNATPLNRAVLEQYNPCLQDRAFGPLKFQPLPVNYELLLPRNLARSVSLALQKLSSPQYSAR